MVDYSHAYGSFQEQKCLSYTNGVDLYTCTDLGCLEISFFDSFWHVFDSFWHFFDSPTDRQTDRPTNRPMKGVIEAPSPELKKYVWIELNFIALLCRLYVTLHSFVWPKLYLLLNCRSCKACKILKIVTNRVKISKFDWVKYSRYF